MKIILNESQYRNLLVEETSGINEFIERIERTYSVTKEFLDKIKNFIETSGCQKIEVAKFKYPALGLALHNGVLYNETIFSLKLPMFLYVVFHEIAHQYQYKKYGAEKMYEFYIGEIDLIEAAEAMKNIELIADEFALRKVREFKNMGLDINIEQLRSIYQQIPLDHFRQLIEMSREQLKKVGYKDFNTIADMFYNMVKVNI